MEELKDELEKLSKAYVDNPENEEKILMPFIKRLLELPMKERRKLLPVIKDLQWIKISAVTTAITVRQMRIHNFFRSDLFFILPPNPFQNDVPPKIKFP